MSAKRRGAGLGRSAPVAKVGNAAPKIVRRGYQVTKRLVRVDRLRVARHCAGKLRRLWITPLREHAKECARSVKMPTRPPPSTTMAGLALCWFISRAASLIVVLAGNVKGLRSNQSLVPLIRNQPAVLARQLTWAIMGRRRSRRFPPLRFAECPPPGLLSEPAASS